MNVMSFQPLLTHALCSLQALYLLALWKGGFYFVKYSMK